MAGPLSRALSTLLVVVLSTCPLALPPLRIASGLESAAAMALPNSPTSPTTLPMVSLSAVELTFPIANDIAPELLIVILGTVFLWFGWFGFNGGSALAANLRATQAAMVTNVAASVGGLTWLLLDYRIERKWSAVGFCSGAVAG